MFCCHGNVKFRPQNNFFFSVCVNHVLNCKYLFSVNGNCATKKVFQVYVRHFYGVAAMVTLISNIA